MNLFNYKHTLWLSCCNIDIYPLCKYPWEEASVSLEVMNSPVLRAWHVIHSVPLIACVISSINEKHHIVYIGYFVAMIKDIWHITERLYILLAETGMSTIENCTNINYIMVIMIKISNCDYILLLWLLPETISLVITFIILFYIILFWYRVLGSQPRGWRFEPR